MKASYKFWISIILTVASSLSIATPDVNSSQSLTGPTVSIKPDKDNLNNDTPNFMYFVPLIAPTSVTSRLSDDNKQRCGIISFTKHTTATTFSCFSEFKMQGPGFYLTTFDPNEMIARNIPDLKPGAPLKNIIRYIKFQGEGFGSIEIYGKYENKKAKVTTMIVHFAGRDCPSPVTAGLYSILPAEGKYKYENRYSEIVAIIDSLTFTESKTKPMMDIVVSSIYPQGGQSGFWSRVKASLANFFIDPIEIDKLGNDTMLDSGCALFLGQETYTFPHAYHLK